MDTSPLEHSTAAMIDVMTSSVRRFNPGLIGGDERKSTVHLSLICSRLYKLSVWNTMSSLRCEDEMRLKILSTF